MDQMLEKDDRASSEAGKILLDWGQRRWEEAKRLQTWGSQEGLPEVQPRGYLYPRVASKQKPTSFPCVDAKSHKRSQLGRQINHGSSVSALQPDHQEHAGG